MAHGPNCPQCRTPMIPKQSVTGQGSGLALGCLLCIVGVLIMAIPVIGWIMGPIAILVGLFQGGRRSRIWLCPNGACQHSMPRHVMSNGEIGVRIALCVVVGWLGWALMRSPSKPTRPNNVPEPVAVQAEAGVSADAVAPIDEAPVPAAVDSNAIEVNLLGLRRGLAVRDIDALLGVAGSRKFRMKDRGGVMRSTYEWVLPDGRTVEGKFQEDRLDEWDVKSR